MVLQHRGRYWYGDSAADIRDILAQPYHGVLPCTHFAEVVCECGGRVFDLLIDDENREAGFPCLSCERNYLFHLADNDGPYDGDPNANTDFRACPCDNNPNCRFEIVVGVCLAEVSDIPRQVSIGCRCTKCGLTGSYADWDNVQLPYQRVFAHIRNRVALMTADEWEQSTDPRAMLLAAQDRADPRLIWRFIAVFGRRVWDQLPWEGLRKAIVTTERWLEGQASEGDLNGAWFDATAGGASLTEGWATARELLEDYEFAKMLPPQELCDMMRRVLGNPFRS